jgi:predicted nucleotide-binding protein
VVFELGCLMRECGRARVCLLSKPGVEIPSDLASIIYLEMDAHEGWHKRLALELKEAGLPIDPAKLLS